MKTAQHDRGKVRYAVVGLGYIAQIAVLPAFAHARKNSELVALISDDPRKRRTLSKKYRINQTCSYDEFDQFLQSGAVDAVYIALPNHMHCEFTLRAAAAGVHILCEKPLAVTEEECGQMIRATNDNGLKLMTAYRLHFDDANLQAAKIVQSGRLGEPRIFNSVFTMQVKKGDIRLQRDLGGGTLYDIGTYCINAARYLFRDEPNEVTAFTVKGTGPRFGEVDEMTSAVLRFPQDRLANFTTSFGAAENSWYQVVGTKGSLYLSDAYEYASKRELHLDIGGKTSQQSFAIHDQFAAELLYFSDCILKDKKPEPSGEEGRIDVKIIQALYRSAAAEHPVRLEGIHKDKRPSLLQKIVKPKVEKPELVHATPPSRD